MATDSGVSPGEATQAKVPASRIDLLDVLRGVALLAMAIYHFTWDLEFFGYVERGMTGVGGWKLFARCIASSFLFLVGVSLVLAHGRGIRWRAFWKRFLQVAAGAAAISAVTAMVTPGSFVFFGILHEIALASLVGLFFLRLPWFATALAAIAVIALPQVVSTPLTDPKWLAWIGMAETPPLSNDFVPLFPWLGAVLFGIAAARLAGETSLWNRLRALNPGLTRAKPLGWLGRHSLLFYLLHQPLLFGLVAGIAQLAPPDPARIVEQDCRRTCNADRGDAALCTAYCGCVVTGLRTGDLLKALLDGTTTTDEDARIGDMVRQCSPP